MAARNPKSKQAGRPPKLPSAPPPRRVPNDTAFDWSAEEHATSHGFTVFQIEDAFLDPAALSAYQRTANRAGGSYSEDGRIALLAQPQPDGPLLHVVFVVAEGRIRPFHCREMNPSEARRYRASR